MIGTSDVSEYKLSALIGKVDETANNVASLFKPLVYESDFQNRHSQKCLQGNAPANRLPIHSAQVRRKSCHQAEEEENACKRLATKAYIVPQEIFAEASVQDRCQNA